MIEFLDLIKSNSNVEMYRQLDGMHNISKTYGEYLKDIRICAYNLKELLGEIKGKHIGILSNSNYEYLVLLGAIIFSRGVVVPLNNNEIEENICSAIQIASLDTLIVSEHKDKYSFKDVTIIAEEAIFEKNLGEIELKDFEEKEKENLSLILFTSGTTSLSKGVSMSVANLFTDIRYIYPQEIVNNIEKAKGIKAYTNFPFYHIAGIILWLSFCANGSTMYYSKEPKNILIDLEHVKIDYAAVSPAVLKLWVNCIKHGRTDRLGGAKDILTGSAPLDIEVVKFFNEHGITIGQFYGQTEVGGAVTCNYDMIGHMASVGKAIRDAEVFIEDGEICVKFWGNMQGYFNNPEETKKCCSDGVVYTGDLGYIDDDGYVYITGRKKNLIILSGGENVSPEELENKLYKSKEIKECVVYEKNDRITADIYAPGCAEKKIKEIINDLNRNVPVYKRISSFKLLENEFEKTSVGKIKR